MSVRFPPIATLDDFAVLQLVVRAPSAHMTAWRLIAQFLPAFEDHMCAVSRNGFSRDRTDEGIRTNANFVTFPLPAFCGGFPAGFRHASAFRVD